MVWQGGGITRRARSIVSWIADTWAIMPIYEKGSTMTVSCPKFDTNTGTFHPDGSTSVRPTTKPVFSENTVRPSSRPLGGNDRPPTVRVVQCRTASECGGIEQCPTLNTRPDSAASLWCSWSDTPSSVNSNPFLMSNVCGIIDTRVSVQKNRKFGPQSQEWNYTRWASRNTVTVTRRSLRIQNPAGEIESGSWSNMILHIIKNIYANFHAFITIWTIV